MAHRVLVVEDDHGLRDVLARGLREEHFEVLTAADGAGALRVVDDRVDAVVLDIGLPDSDGRDVCHAMRAAGVQVPVLFLTAHDGLADRLSGFSAGGDDYLAKPFHLSELAARVRAALRRGGREPGVEVDGLRLDPVAHVVETAGGEPVSLTPTEFRLLACLMSAPGAAVRRQSLLRAAWPEGAQVSDNTLDQYLVRLRRKLREAGSARGILTVRGVGYRFA
ncbi:response regulator transcription factor [Streptomyces sp. H10-C2]|uniref:response regulator transcription factor n=1 Tax=unclassified Streptomyces TaxID=2593676 RepID=UPI0024BB5A8E|nr:MULTISPECIES: response regulator transcription factor [unclassified Streptomyces]MDJ0343935.1 response regulator transcription factor [Streptomyces sp. PH10-H1]MDJ0373376.1 response regulator transcription factor [Streptomyces sp. H10-C2]